MANPNLPPRLNSAAIMRPKWEWLNKFPETNPDILQFKRLNAAEHDSLKVAFLQWEDGTLCKIIVIGGFHAQFPCMDADTLTVIYRIGRAQMERVLSASSHVTPSRTGKPQRGLD
jgi:hypothetical protein